MISCSCETGTRTCQHQIESLGCCNNITNVYAKVFVRKLHNHITSRCRWYSILSANVLQLSSELQLNI